MIELTAVQAVRLFAFMEDHLKRVDFDALGNKIGVSFSGYYDRMYGQKKPQCSKAHCISFLIQELMDGKNLLKSLKVGGVYGYKTEPIFFLKTAKNEFTLMVAIGGTKGLDNELGRWQNVLDAAGIKFIDGR